MPTVEEKLIIKELLIGLGRGESSGGNLCPFCNGGMSLENSFSVGVSNEGRSWYKCHRAKCGEAGLVEAPIARMVSDKPLWTKPQTTTLPTFTHWQHYNDKSGQSLKDYLKSFYGIDPEQMWFHGRVDRKTDDIWFRVGENSWTVKNIWDKSRSRTYLEPGDVAVGMVGSSGPYIIVEDMLSAIKVWLAGYTGICLCGTNLSLDKVGYIAEATTDSDGNPEEILLCLDKDATQKAAALVKQYRLLLPRMRLKPINRDLKYESVEFIKTLVGNNGNKG